MRRLIGDLPGEVAALSAVAFAVAVGFGIVAPVIPLFATEFGVGATAAGAVVSAFAFMRLVSALAGGRFVDLVGERTTLVTGLLVVAVSSGLAGLAQTYTQLLVLRGVGGIGSALFTVSAISLLLRVVRPDQRGRATSVWQAGFLVGGLAGPVFGGVLAEISLRAPFFVYAGTLGAATVVALVALAGTRLRDDPTADGGPPVRTTLRQALRLRAYWAAVVTNLGTGWALFGVRSSVVPLYVADALGRTPLWVGVGFLVGSAGQAAALWPAARVVDQVGRKPAMVSGGLVAVGSVALLATWQTLPVFLVAMAGYGVGAAFLGSAPAAVVGDVVTGRGGTVVAAFQMASDLGAVAGPLVAGWLVDGFSFGAAFWVTALVLSAGTVLATRMPETRPDPVPQAPGPARRPEPGPSPGPAPDRA
ncbi:MFS transporter [Thalassiella azotivora]